ncbi:MAG TPA: cytochrome C oxidase subunit IV family protein [Bacteroidota bacterium]|jgi:cytochrome c oxidase subunit 4|nr:cytochrome C oxidase subunit IV family protein [Bacteroidota bacterium]
MEATTNIEEFKKHHVRKYIIVFVSLMGLTIVTVTVASFHLSVTTAIMVALLIAAIKGSLVASYFMHLISEKKMIFMTLILTVVFFAVLMGLPLFHHANPITIK